MTSLARPKSYASAMNFILRVAVMNRAGTFDSSYNVNSPSIVSSGSNSSDQIPLKYTAFTSRVIMLPGMLSSPRKSLIIPFVFSSIHVLTSVQFFGMGKASAARFDATSSTYDCLSILDQTEFAMVNCTSDSFPPTFSICSINDDATNNSSSSRSFSLPSVAPSSINNNAVYTDIGERRTLPVGKVSQTSLNKDVPNDGDWSFSRI
mmetsp:Transcript_28175/g.59501  ORF Transcript_28175/g.59501 Transcript_28175/m.59501 type:complete len:206 (+) Transcript_28175:619-1236(+)